MVEAVHVVVRARMLAQQRLFQRTQQRTGYARRLHLIAQRLAVVLQCDLSDLVLDGAEVSARVVGHFPIGIAHAGILNRQRVEEPLVGQPGGTKRDPVAIAGLVQTSDDQRGLLPPTLRRVAGVRSLLLHPVGELTLPAVDRVEQVGGRVLQGDAGLIERSADVLPSTCELALIERAGDAEREQCAGVKVTQIGVEDLRFVALEVGRRHRQTRRRCGLKVSSQMHAEGSRFAHRRDFGHDDPLVLSTERLIIESKAIERAWSHVGDEDVAAQGELTNDLATFRMTQVDRRAALATRLDDVVATLAMDDRAVPAGGVACDRLNLDHVRATVGQ